MYFGKIFLSLVFTVEIDSKCRIDFYHLIYYIKNITEYRINLSIFFFSYEADDNEDGLETVKTAFLSMGFSNIIENESQRKLKGEVIYRKRNIRRQSFQLMAELKRLKTKYKTIDDAETVVKYTNKVMFSYFNIFDMFIFHVK